MLVRRITCTARDEQKSPIIVNTAYRRFTCMYFPGIDRQFLLCSAEKRLLAAYKIRRASRLAVYGRAPKKIRDDFAEWTEGFFEKLETGGDR